MGREAWIKKSCIIEENTCDQIYRILNAELELYSETIISGGKLFLFCLGWLLPLHTKEEAECSHITDFCYKLNLFRQYITIMLFVCCGNTQFWTLFGLKFPFSPLNSCSDRFLCNHHHSFYKMASNSPVFQCFQEQTGRLMMI